MERLLLLVSSLVVLSPKLVLGDFFSGPLYPGSLGIAPNFPVPTKYTITLIITITVLVYTTVNLFRRFYLERYVRDTDGKLYPVECKPTKSLIDGLFSLSARWGIVKPPLTRCSQQHMFAGWAHAFTQCGRYWKKIGDGMVTVTHYPEADKYKLLMKNTCDVVLINHELTKNMALFRDENQGVYISRWSAVDFASLQPRSETFCLRWNNLGAAECFNQTFYKCTQPAYYSDNDIFPVTAADREPVPAALRQMDLTTQWPQTANHFAQTSMPPMTCRPTCPTMPCTRLPGEPLYDMFTEEQGAGGREGGYEQPDEQGKPSNHSIKSSKRSKRRSSGGANKPNRSRSRIKSAPSRVRQPSDTSMSRASTVVKGAPSRMGPQKSQMERTQSRTGRSASRMGPAPSRTGRSASRIAPSASRMGKSASRMGKSASKMASNQQSRMGRPSTVRSQRSQTSPKSRASMRNKRSVYR